MKMSSKVLVLGAKRYDFTQEGTGEKVAGCKVSYVDGLDGVEKQNNKGLEIASCNLPYEIYDKLGVLPSWFSMDFEMQVNTKGQTILKPVGLTFTELFKYGK